MPSMSDAKGGLGWIASCPREAGHQASSKTPVPLVKPEHQKQDPSWLRRAARELSAPVDIASLACFRIVFGGLMLLEVAVYLKKGWVEALFIDPRFHFTFPGFDWVKPWPGHGMVTEFWVMAAASLCMALGMFHRIAATVFFIGITHVFLCESAEYLNHLYLICLIAFLMIFVPAHRAWSVDAWRKPSIRSNTVPACWLWLMRGQIGIPYFFGGIAKLNPDWLRGEPLRMWLAKRTDFPVIGRWFTEDWMVYAFSYSGLLLDLAIVPLLLWKRTRLAAYLLVLCFNGMNAMLFNIGIFPWMMIGASLLFFPPEWPRFGRKPKGDPGRSPAASPKPALVFCTVFLAVQILIPLRHWLYPGDVAWTEEGHYFSWRMKLRDKQAETSFAITDPASGHSWEIEPGEFLTERQKFRMNGHPDLIHQFALHLAEEYRREYGMEVEVRAKSSASLNGRAPAMLLDSECDLAKEERGFRPKTWIWPSPGGGVSQPNR